MRKGINLYSTYNIAAIIPSIWWLRWASIKAKPFTKQSFIRKKRDHMMVSDCNKLWVQTLPVRGLLDSSLWRHSGHIQLRGNPFGKTKSMLAWESLRIPQVLPCMAEDKHHWATSRRWAVKMMAQWKTYMLCISDCICIFFFFFLSDVTFMFLFSSVLTITGYLISVFINDITYIFGFMQDQTWGYLNEQPYQTAEMSANNIFFIFSCNQLHWKFLKPEIRVSFHVFALLASIFFNAFLKVSFSMQSILFEPLFPCEILTSPPWSQFSLR